MLRCNKHNIFLECMGGESAHESNWYCPLCDREKEGRKMLADELDQIATWHEHQSKMRHSVRKKFRHAESAVYIRRAAERERGLVEALRLADYCLGAWERGADAELYYVEIGDVRRLLENPKND